MDGVDGVDGVNNGEPSFKARIWRIPSKSIASSATAYLQGSSIVKRLPAAPGMMTSFLDGDGDKPEQILIHCYSARKNTYLVSKIGDGSEENKRVDIITALSRDASMDEGAEEVEIEVEKTDESDSAVELFEIGADQVETSKSAKFYPLIDELISRGNEAALAAKIIAKESKVVESTIDSHGKVSSTSAKVTTMLKTSIPATDDVRSIYNMLKDDELTVLLEKGKHRLEHLSSRGLNAATENALKEMGVTINDEYASPSFLAQVQGQALSAIDELLAENLDVNFDAMKTSMQSTFETMFDSFSSAAQSDGALSDLLDQINGKTSEWQKQTGRLLDTKSSSLFLEGAQRIQSRVGNLLSPQLFDSFNKSSLTKAFTEGDVALAKLKSLELGDSIRTRLFDAIEVRSETHGGLDGIIAEAMEKIGGNEVLTSIKSGSSNIATDAQESLISLLSQRSEYHDVSIMHVENTLVRIESHLDGKMTAEQIASLARGEGGTAMLFEPVAKNAAKEIEKQLDAIEESVDDVTILTVISHVRKIMSGELTVANLFDEAITLLNNDDVVNAGATFAQRGEQLLDAIETASENQAVSHLIDAVEKAGITKESVVEKIERIDVNTILDTAGQAVSDEEKRVELLSSATDSALDFLLRILPAMPVPPFEGVRDGIIYSIDNLSMKGFRLKKEDIMVEIAGIKAAKQSNSTATIVQDPMTGNDVASRKSKTTDILIIDVRNISALLEDAIWKFEKTSFPYLKRDGTANVNLSDGTIRLEFDLRKRKTKDDKFEPVLSLHNSFCAIGKIDLTIDGASGLAWVVNKLAAIFQGPLKNYVVKVIMDILKNRSGWLLQNLNGILSPHWDLILKMTGMALVSLLTENTFMSNIPFIIS